MTGEEPQATVFGRGTSVLDYWLANAEGFHVVATRKPGHRVDHVLVDRQLGSATVLIVRRKRGRRLRRIPAVEVSAVDPFERVLYLAPKRRVRSVTARSAAWAAPRVVASARSTRMYSLQGARWLQPRVAASARSTGRGSVDAVRWLKPRVVKGGRSAYAALLVAAAQVLPLVRMTAALLRVAAGQVYRSAFAASGAGEAGALLRGAARRVLAAALLAPGRVADAARNVAARVRRVSIAAVGVVRSARRSPWPRQLPPRVERGGKIER